jgi:hypothetical protein
VGGACGMHRKGEKHVQDFGGKAEGKDHLKDQGVDGRMGSKWMLGRLVVGGVWSGFPMAQGSLAGCCECGDEPSGSGATELVILVFNRINESVNL